MTQFLTQSSPIPPYMAFLIIRNTLKSCPAIWHPAENSIPVTQPPYEAGHCVTILLLSNEPMNVRRMKAYETNQ